MSDFENDEELVEFLKETEAFYLEEDDDALALMREQNIDLASCLAHDHLSDSASEVAPEDRPSAVEEAPKEPKTPKKPATKRPPKKRRSDTRTEKKVAPKRPRRESEPPTINAMHQRAHREKKKKALVDLEASEAALKQENQELKEKNEDLEQRNVELEKENRRLMEELDALRELHVLPRHPSRG